MSVLHEFRRRLDAAKAAFVEPSLPTLAEKPPSGPRWIHEIKHDGYRLQARKDDGGVHLITRNGFVWTKRYPSIAAALMALPCKSCVIDGEVVVVDEHGLAVFDRLRYGAREKPEALLYAFDPAGARRDGLAAGAAGDAQGGAGAVAGTCRLFRPTSRTKNSTCDARADPEHPLCRAH
jgi:hypothetical protein